MSNKKNPHIISILGQDTALANLVSHAKYLAGIHQIVQHQLTRSMQPHCKVANYRENILYLHVDSPSWATRLRFTVPELISQLKNTKELNELKDIQILPAKSTQRDKTLSQEKLELSKETAEQLICLANYVTDPKLALALRRLAKKKG